MQPYSLGAAGATGTIFKKRLACLKLETLSYWATARTSTSPAPVQSRIIGNGRLAEMFEGGR
jgi:hypothetical protein